LVRSNERTNETTSENSVSESNKAERTIKDPLQRSFTKAIAVSSAHRNAPKRESFTALQPQDRYLPMTMDRCLFVKRQAGIARASNQAGS